MTPSAIAAAMSEAQKRAVLDHGPEFQRLMRPGNGRGAAASRTSAIKPIRDLFERKWGGDCFRYRLTPLGLAVRQHLQEHAK